MINEILAITLIINLKFNTFPISAFHIKIQGKFGGYFVKKLLNIIYAS
jgi:hypothetical protein